MGLPEPSNIRELISLLAPGFILLWMRSRVFAGPTPSIQERLISYALASGGYFAAVSPLFFVSSGQPLPSWLWNLLHYFGVPLVIGVLIAHAEQWGWQYKVADWLGLKFSHHIPAAWDFTFSRVNASTFVLVTMGDGSQIAGLMSDASFASSSRDERDLLLEEVFVVTEKGPWKPAEPSRSILICGKDIRVIEIFRRSEGG
jgi:hypothetical protein